MASEAASLFTPRRLGLQVALHHGLPKTLVGGGFRYLYFQASLEMIDFTDSHC